MARRALLPDCTDTAIWLSVVYTYQKLFQLIIVNSCFLLQSFEGNSLQCRMNHARMAIKEGVLTNNPHCVHATISGSQRCKQTQKGDVQFKNESELGRDVFYNPSEWLSPDNDLGLSKFQTLVASINFLISLRGRLYITYPSQYQDDSSTSIICATTDLRYRSSD